MRVAAMMQGAAVLKMVEGFLEPATFRDGIRVRVSVNTTVHPRRNILSCAIKILTELSINLYSH